MQKIRRGWAIGGLAIFLGVLMACAVKAQLTPPDPFYELNSWEFLAPGYLSDAGDGPIASTNLLNPSSFDGNAVQIDAPGNAPAFLNYAIADDISTNLTFGESTIEFWVLPDWNSGTGPGGWGRLIDVGMYSTNRPSSWFSLYVSPDGCRLNFSSVTDGVFTNYLGIPIAWDTNTYHLIDLCHTHFHSQLYVDGQLATNGPGVFYEPSDTALSSGFFLGSASGGDPATQARAQFDDLATFDHVLSAAEVTNDYAYGAQLIAGGGFHGDYDIPPSPDGGGSGGGTNSYTYTNTPPNYGTNLWLALLGISNQVASLLLTNTASDTLYELQGSTNLALGNWFSEGFVYGSELTNGTPSAVATSKLGNLFLRIRSWVDDTGTGIPDWWWLQYFGEITNVNAYADPLGDGYDYLQKFQMGLDPTLYFTTSAPGGFFGALDASGTNAFLEWSPAPGPVLNYAIQRGIQNTNGSYVYAQIALVSSNASLFEDVGAISNANAQNNIYNLVAVYPGGSLSATDTWNVSWYVDTYENSYNDGPPDGPPMPNNVYAYTPATGSNVLVSWTPAAGRATNYIVELVSLDPDTYEYDYLPLAAVGTNLNYYEDVGALAVDEASNYFYAVEAVFPGNVLSQTVLAYPLNATPAPPPNFMASVDSNGTNVLLSWTPPAGMVVTNYTIEQGVLNTNTGLYSYTVVGTANGSANSFEVFGAITGNNSYNNSYTIVAMYAGGSESQTEYFYLQGPPPAPIYNLRISAQLVRGPTGHWLVALSHIPPDVQALLFTWNYYYYDSDLSNFLSYTESFPAVSATNGFITVPDSDATNLTDYSEMVFNDVGQYLYVQALGTNGALGPVANAGFISEDAACWVDGRQHLKQDLLFKTRAATISQPCEVSGTVVNYIYIDYYEIFTVAADTNYAESGLFHPAYQYKTHGTNGQPEYVNMSDLWPFEVNYQLHQRLWDTNNPNVPSSFVWSNLLVTVPAPAVLGISDPYWISQSFTNLADFAAYTNDGDFYLESGKDNLFGLPFGTAIVNPGGFQYTYLGQFQSDPVTIEPFATLAPGNSTSETSVSVFYSQTADPDLEPDGYYFATVNTPGTALPGDAPAEQLAPIPSLTGFANTNETGLLVASVGAPSVIGGWAKFAIANGNPAKFAYLGQYYETNAFVMTNGAVTTNTTGIVSPYGDFFPTAPGMVAMVTRPDIDTGLQGTGVVRVISLNVDANHDGTLDFTYAGPDQTSSSRPFRFWVNDVNDAGDDSGDGIPGQGTAGDGMIFSDGPDNLPLYTIQGTRNLVNFFPVYLNIGSLFQSNALSAGISVTDTNYQFILSQADGALRFAYTDLTPTNYMNFLRDTNEVLDYLRDAPLMTVSNLNSGGVPVNAFFLSQIAANNGGIILVEAWTNTAQPLVLTIYHGTSQIAQTSLYLSISGVEQMFRSKTILLSSYPQTNADRLTDAQVPNEPDTIDKNFVFIHGYNVNPTYARGWFADIYKRMYWSGSHAKFYGITWEGYDTQGTIPFTPLVTPDFHSNAFNAFKLAGPLASFLATLTNDTLVAAHSLGNLLTLSAINDWNAPIDKYFMLDAAVAMEDIQSDTPATNAMVYSDWLTYSNWLYASEWRQLFPTNDARSALTWNGRLANFQNVNVYNFYSSGEEVLREDNNDPPFNLFSSILPQVTSVLLGARGEYAWVWQEKAKGRANFDTFLGSTHGGWKFNDWSYGTNNNPYNPAAFTHMSPSAAAALSTNQLKTNAFFDLTDYQGTLPVPWTNDLALYGPGGSAYAATNRNRILSDAIPALTLPVGANHVGILAPDGEPDKNFNMQTFENGWPSDRLDTSETNNWHHSDLRVVAYTFTHQLFDQMVSTGNLR